MLIATACKAGSLEELCSLLGSESFDGEEVVTIYKKHPDFDPTDCFPLHHYLKHCRVIAVKRALREVSEKYPHLSFRRFPLERLRARRHVFREDSLSRVIAYRVTKRKKLAPEITYETLVAFQGSCLFIESRLGGARRGEDARCRVELLREVLGDGVKHVQVIPPEFMGASQPFLSSGYLAPFFMSAEEFKAQIEEALQRHHLLYTKL